jgi:hypothetical protein
VDLKVGGVIIESELYGRGKLQERTGKWGWGCNKISKLTSKSRSN